MDDFEERLRRLSLEAPGADLDRRIEGILRNATGRPSRPPRSVPLWLTAVVGIVCGFVGAGLGRVSLPPTVEPAPTTLKIETVHAYPVPNPFDWSGDTATGPQGIQAAIVTVEVTPWPPATADTSKEGLSL